MVNAFRLTFCPKGSKVRFASCLLKDKARYWWEEVDFTLGGEAIETMTWDEFVTWFRADFALAGEVQQLAREFQDLLQMTETVAKIAAKFRERALLDPQYAVDEDMKKTRYCDMLRDNIREFVIFLACRNLKDMIARSQEREIDLEYMGKRKLDQVHTVGGPAKRPRFLISS